MIIIIHVLCAKTGCKVMWKLFYLYDIPVNIPVSRRDTFAPGFRQSCHSCKKPNV